MIPVASRDNTFLVVGKNAMMRRLISVGWIVSLIAAPALADGIKDARGGEATFTVNKKAKNSVGLISKAPGETFKGTGKTIDGTLTLDPSKLDSASGEFRVPFKNLDTGNRLRNQHMLSSRWIDAAKYPEAVFTVSGIEKVKAGPAVVKANLTGMMAIHGQEKEMSIPVTIVYVKDKADSGTHDTLAVKANFNIKLDDFGIKDPAVGNKVAENMRLAVSVTMESGKSGKSGKPAKKDAGEKAAAE